MKTVYILILLTLILFTGKCIAVEEFNPDVYLYEINAFVENRDWNGMINYNNELKLVYPNEPEIWVVELIINDYYYFDYNGVVTASKNIINDINYLCDNGKTDRKLAAPIIGDVAMDLDILLSYKGEEEWYAELRQANYSDEEKWDQVFENGVIEELSIAEKLSIIRFKNIDKLIIIGDKLLNEALAIYKSNGGNPVTKEEVYVSLKNKGIISEDEFNKFMKYFEYNIEFIGNDVIVKFQMGEGYWLPPMNASLLLTSNNKKIKKEIHRTGLVPTDVTQQYEKQKQWRFVSKYGDWLILMK